QSQSQSQSSSRSRSRSRSSKPCHLWFPPLQKDPRSSSPIDIKKQPAFAGCFHSRHQAIKPDHASTSSLYASTGIQAHIMFLSPYTLSTRATGGQYFCSFSEGSGKAASSRG